MDYRSQKNNGLQITEMKKEKKDNNKIRYLI